jgi:acid phosphatase
MMKRLQFVFAGMLAVAMGASCAAGQRGAPRPATEKKQPVIVVDAQAERIPNFDLVKKELKQYHDCTCTCGCYAHDLDRQADRAIAFLRRRAAGAHSGKKLAVVLDIDETSLSGYEQLLKMDFEFDKKQFDAWVDRAQEPAIPGTLRLYKEAQQLGVSVFFITGRPESQKAVTERNLESQGFRDWQGLMLRPESTRGETVDAYKASMRAQVAAQGYKIVLNVGDQWSDLKGNPEAEYSVKYPDPFYFLP